MPGTVFAWRVTEAIAELLAGHLLQLKESEI